MTIPSHIGDLPDRDGYESAAMYSRERKEREARETTAQISLKHGMALAGITPEPAGPQFAHKVFPDPVKPEYIHTSEAENSGLAEQLATYHATRAWAFHLASLEGHITAASVSLLVTEFHLARLYFLLCTTGRPHHHLDRIAAFIGTTQRWQPQNVAPEIAEILEWAGIDPASIRAYLP